MALLIVVLLVAGCLFALGYLLGRDVADAETSIQVEAFERAQRIRAATLETARQIVQATERPE